MQQQAECAKEENCHKGTQTETSANYGLANSPGSTSTRCSQQVQVFSNAGTRRSSSGQVCKNSVISQSLVTNHTVGE
jgi:hypothetical protein